METSRSRSSSGSVDDGDAALPPSTSQANVMYPAEREEVYITPGTVEGSVDTFAARFHKNQYLEVLRLHLDLDIFFVCFKFMHVLLSFLIFA